MAYTAKETLVIASVATFISFWVSVIAVEHTIQEECEETQLFSPRIIGEPIMCATKKDYAHD